MKQFSSRSTATWRGSGLLSADSDKEKAKKARGRPDISLKDKNRKRLLVIECKFSV